MAGIQIALILSFLLLFVFSREVWVRVIKDERMNIEIHLPLLAICLSSKENSKNKKDSNRISIKAYIGIILDVLHQIRDCKVIIKRISLPMDTSSFSSTTLVKPFAYQGLIYALIAYLKTKVRNITINNNAITSSPDINDARFYLTVKLRLFQLIYALMTFRQGVKEEKRARKGYVGE